MATAPDNGSESFSLEHQDYLFEKYVVTYGYSATTLLKSLERRQTSTEGPIVAAFAPIYEGGNEKLLAMRGGDFYVDEAGDTIVLRRGCHRDSLETLYGSIDEVESIERLLSSKLFMGNQATRRNLEIAARNHPILHLAIHACVDDRDPMYNRLYLADSTMETFELSLIHI